MNTFLPFNDFYKSADCLDYKRAFKQVLEASQIINVLNGESKGWSNHPAVKMWVGYKDALILYYNTFWDVCKYKWNVNFIKLQPKNNIDSCKIIMPPWLGYPKFHSLMRANLVRKNPEWYKFEESPQKGYFWPCDSNGEIKEEIKQWIAIHRGTTTTFGIHSK